MIQLVVQLQKGLERSGTLLKDRNDSEVSFTIWKDLGWPGMVQKGQECLLKDPEGSKGYRRVHEVPEGFEESRMIMKGSKESRRVLNGSNGH